MTVITKSEYDEILEPDEDFYSAISAKELLEMLHEDIHQMFNEKRNEGNIYTKSTGIHQTPNTNTLRERILWN